MPASDNTVLRHLKRTAASQDAEPPLRVVGIDDWSWRKGWRYGTIIADLERRQVTDVLPGRSAKETARWLAAHPIVEIVSRDRCGLYAQAARQGTPEAQQVADWFHLLKNLREMIEEQMNRVSQHFGRPRLPARGDAGRKGASTEEDRIRRTSCDARQAIFDKVQALRAGGMTMRAIAKAVGVGWRTVTKWVRSGRLEPRRQTALRPSSPAYFRDFLTEQWAAGNRRGRLLFLDLRNRGYTGSFSHLERLLAQWRRADRKLESRPAAPESEGPAIDPMTGWQISPIVAAALCLKPRGMLTPAQAAKVDALKQASPSFVVMRQLAMRFRGLLRGHDTGALDKWLDDARCSRLTPIQRYARTLKRDLDAVRAAIVTPWSNGQLEGQINRLKTIRRAMYGRGSIELLRARMLPLRL